LLVEMWESRSGGWEKLTKQERQNIIGQIQEGVGQLINQGLKSLGFFINDPDEGKYREHWRFVAVWELPSKELLDKMLPQVEELPGWFDVMNEKRVWGKIQTPDEGADILLNWGNAKAAPATLMGRLETLEKQVAEISGYLKEIRESIRESKKPDDAE
jgi:hypothetical protein